MGILIAVVIILAAVILAGIGAYIVIYQDRNESDGHTESVSHSGIYSVVRASPRDSMERIKPNSTQIGQWVQSARPDLSEERVQALLSQWKESVESSIQTVDECDKNGISTFHVTMTDKDRPVCPFLSEDNYLTREQIYNHPELLPPYYLGCGCKLIAKPADATASWKAVVPVEGHYQVPDWRQIV